VAFQVCLEKAVRAVQHGEPVRLLQYVQREAHVGRQRPCVLLAECQSLNVSGSRATCSGARAKGTQSNAHIGSLKCQTNCRSSADNCASCPC
jgi:hypothetical protein